MVSARAIWKGVIRFGTIAVPIKLYSAVQDRHVHFRLLHRDDRTPVQQKMVHPATGEAVPAEQIRRGFEFERGRILLLEAQELASLEPSESRDIEITRFVPPSRINHQWYDRPYYLGPDGKAGPYHALADALRKENVEGVAHWTMRRKQYLGALQEADGRLRMITLRHAEEVVDISSVDVPQGRALSAPEIRMARQLVEALADTFNPSAFRDEYRERVKELIQVKARGGRIELKPAEQRRPPLKSLEDMLRQSIQQAREQRKSA